MSHVDHSEEIKKANRPASISRRGTSDGQKKIEHVDAIEAKLKRDGFESDEPRRDDAGFPGAFSAEFD